MMEEALKRQGDPLTCPVAFVFKDGKILLGYRNYKSDKWKEISVWTVPGGRCDGAEPLEETLRRETFEETGIKDLIITEYLGEVPGAKEGDIVPIFLARTDEEPILMEPEKFSEWKWFKVSDIPENFINPKAKALLQRHLGV